MTSDQFIGVSMYCILNAWDEDAIIPIHLVESSMSMYSFHNQCSSLTFKMAQFPVEVKMAIRILPQNTP